MATLTVWKFDTSDGARTALDLLRELQEQQLIGIRDAAYVYWEADGKRPKTKELGKLTGAGALGGAFWGLLFGIIFFIPILGLAVGAAAGAIAGSLAHVGIDDNFIGEIRGKVTPGTSALFVLTSDAVLDKVVERLHQTGLHAELVHTNLTGEQEQQVRDAFAEG